MKMPHIPLENLMTAIESAFIVTNRDKKDSFVMTFNNKPFCTDDGLVRIFTSVSSAKAHLTLWIRIMFQQAPYWNRYKDNVKKQTSKDINLSAVLFYDINAHYENEKQTFKEITEQLIDKGFVEIVSLSML